MAEEYVDVLVVGELRDMESVALALSAAETGVLVFATMHTNSAAKSVHRLIDLVPDSAQDHMRGMISVLLRGVIAQRLTRGHPPITRAHLFERDGADLHCEIPVSIAQAALGCEVDVPNLEGKESVELKPGTQSGDLLRRRGRGLPRLGGGPRGDIIARIFVEVPTKLNAKQRELLEEFARVTGDEVSPRRRGFLDKLRDLFE